GSGAATQAFPPNTPGLGRPSPRRAALFARPRPAGANFEDTVLVHLDAAYSLARYLARDTEAAEDIVQDAVLKAHRGFAGFRGGDAKAWLLTIVRREFIDWSNARRAGRTVFAEVEEGAEIETTVRAETPSPEEAVLRQGEVAAVRRAIAALPEPFRESIILRELEELSYREVAAITGVPIGTVMSRL
ncbi:sigma-70 family RNA polymerase sigma factor, partial [Mycobacterium tuberculosis]